MSDIIYRFEFKDKRVYIGKLSNEDYISSHLKSLPWINKSGNDAAWDREWFADIMEHGFKEQQTIAYHGFRTVDDLKSIIKNDMDNYYNSRFGQQFSLYESLKTAWGKDDKETIEALCILLELQHNKILANTQIDFLSRTQHRSNLTKNDLDMLISSATFEKRFNVSKNKFANQISINITGGLQNQITNHIQTLIDNHITSEKGVVNIMKELKNSKQNELFQHILSAKISDKTIPHVRSKLTKEALSFSKSKTLQKLIKTTLDDLEKTNGLTYGELADAIKDKLQSNANVRFYFPCDVRDANGKKLRPIQKIAIVLRDWLSQFNIDLFNQMHEIKTYNDIYKEKLTNWMQKQIFGNGKYILNDNAFNAWQNENKRYDDGKHNYRLFYTKYARIKLDSEVETLSFQIKQDVDTKLTNANFFKDNWSKFYEEQVSIWLSKKEPIGRYQNFRGFRHLINYKEITIF